MTVPFFRRIMGDIRARIASGEWPPGTPLPSTKELTTLYAELFGVKSATTVREAITHLINAGELYGKQGAGVYVGRAARLVRESHGRNVRAVGGSPFASDAQAAGLTGTWEHASAHAAADEATARRLQVEPGGTVMRTDYRFLADDRPIQLSTSWEPLAITGGTPVEWPEAGAAVGVVARMDYIGVRIDEVVERVNARSATANETDRLELAGGEAHVITIARTYYAAGVPVETADIVFPGDRYELVYRVPVD